MKTYVKCAYCGKRYSVQQEHDCCPHCGAFNEFDFNEKIDINDIDLNQFFKNFDEFSNDKFDEFKTKKVNNSDKIKIIKTNNLNEFESIETIKTINSNGSQTKTIKVTKKSSSSKLKYKFLILFLMFCFILAFINSVINSIEEENEKNKQREYSFYYSSDLLENPNAYLYGKNESNYVKNSNIDVTVYGTFDELYTYIYKNLINKQFYSMEYDLNVSSEINYKDTTIYIDTISFRMGNYNNSISFGYEIEETDMPSSMKMYLCIGEDRKDRITLLSSDEEKYGNFLTCFFEKSQSYSNYFCLNSEGVYKYEYLLIEIDDEVYKIDLKYDNSETFIKYYGLKESSN